MTVDSINMTRRQALAGLVATATIPFAGPFSNSYAASSAPMRGAYMILSTPYTVDGEVDYEDLAGEVAYLDRCGVQGLVWPQNSSEQRYLSKEERMRGFEVIAEANKGRKGMVAVATRPASA